MHIITYYQQFCCYFFYFCKNVPFVNMVYITYVFKIFMFIHIIPYHIPNINLSTYIDTDIFRKQKASIKIYLILNTRLILYSKIIYKIYFLSDYFQFLRELIQYLNAILCDKNKIFDSHSSVIWKIDSRFDREDHTCFCFIHIC